MMLLHDAIFHLDQQDDYARLRADLAHLDRKNPAVRAFAERIDGVLAQDAGLRAFAAETLRADFHASPCLDPSMHARFHERLPKVTR